LYFHSSADWRNEVLYFLLPDRFSDVRKANFPFSTGRTSRPQGRMVSAGINERSGAEIGGRGGHCRHRIEADYCGNSQRGAIGGDHSLQQTVIVIARNDCMGENACGFAIV